jgi:hypothetical protein
MLNVFPGWLVPFSNTIGYGIANLAGLGDLSADLFIKPSNVEKNKGVDLKTIIEKIYTDRSTFINQLSYDESKGIEQDFWDGIKDLIVTQTPDKDKYETVQAMKEKFIGFLRLKDIVAEFIWFTISGLLVTSISYNYILNIKCKKTIQEMKNTSDNYNKTLSEKEKIKEPRLYTSNE